MATIPPLPAHALSGEVAACLQRVEARAGRARRTATTLLVVGTLTAAAATFVSGLTAATGPIVGSGPEGWTLSCAVAAVLAFTTTVCTGLNQGLRLNDRASRALACAGRLRALDLSLRTGQESDRDATRAYAEVLREYPEEVSAG